ncbi:MAG TPA: DNA gyrase modulator, partial [Bacteroidales bacterium]|nr:DNA gyrase modulator [Bacteroidales bacterium]
MTTKDKYKLADRALEHAMKNGASQARVIINNSQNNSISVREKKIENLEKSIENGLSIYLYVDNKYSVHSTNRLDKWKELAKFIEEAIEGTKYLSEDK